MKAKVNSTSKMAMDGGVEDKNGEVKVNGSGCGQFEAISLSDEAAVTQRPIEAHSEQDISNSETFVNLVSKYIIALRPWSFSASLTPVALGSCLAYKTVGVFNVWVFLTTCLTALSVHSAGNLVNTYVDYMKAVDSKKSDDKTLVNKVLSPNEIATMGGVCYFVGCVGFMMLTVISPAKMEHLALVYFGGLSGSFLYTGGLGLKYIALGDVAIFLTFGPVTVLFAYLSQGGELSWIPLYYAIPLALNTSAILHSNNTRDMENDAEVGIVTLAILIGETASVILFALLLFSPFLIFVLLGIHYSVWFFLPATIVIAAFKHERQFRSGDRSQIPQKTAGLNLQMGICYVVACLMTNNSNLPGISR